MSQYIIERKEINLILNDELLKIPGEFIGLLKTKFIEQPALDANPEFWVLFEGFSEEGDGDEDHDEDDENCQDEEADEGDRSGR